MAATKIAPKKPVAKPVVKPVERESYPWCDGEQQDWGGKGVRAETSAMRRYQQLPSELKNRVEQTYERCADLINSAISDLEIHQADPYRETVAYALAARFSFEMIKSKAATVVVANVKREGPSDIALAAKEMAFKEAGGEKKFLALDFMQQFELLEKCRSIVHGEKLRVARAARATAAKGNGTEEIAH